MTPQICRYAIIQFTPFSETGEFANVGIVLSCPKTGFFKFRLQKRKYKRITDFFEGIERSDYLNAIAATEFELEYVIQKTQNETGDQLRHYFTSLVRPREGSSNLATNVQCFATRQKKSWNASFRTMSSTRLQQGSTSKSA